MLEILCQLISQNKFADANELIRNRHHQLPKAYIDERSSTTVFHIVCQQISGHSSVEFKEDIKTLFTLLVEYEFEHQLADENGFFPIQLISQVATKNIKETRLQNFYIKTFVKSIEEKGLHLLPGKKITNQFQLFMGSKNTRKHCIIPDASISNDDAEMRAHGEITLHQRLRFYRETLPDDTIGPGISGYNLLTANIGFVVSTSVHSKGGTHNRKFVTLPVIHPKFKIFKGQTQVHTEVTLFRYLSEKENVKSILEQLKKQFAISSKHKLYAVILDIFSDEAMCLSCEFELYRIQGNNEKYTPMHNFINVIEEVAEQDFHFVLPKLKINRYEVMDHKAHRLRLVVRCSANHPTSSSITFSQYPEYQNDADSKLLRSEIEADHSKREKFPVKDIKLFPRRILLHGGIDPFQTDFHDEVGLFETPNLSLCSQTVFTTGSKYIKQSKHATDSPYALTWGRQISALGKTEMMTDDESHAKKQKTGLG